LISLIKFYASHVSSRLKAIDDSIRLLAIRADAWLILGILIVVAAPCPTPACAADFLNAPLRQLLFGLPAYIISAFSYGWSLFYDFEFSESSRASL